MLGDDLGVRADTLHSLIVARRRRRPRSTCGPGTCCSSTRPGWPAPGCSTRSARWPPNAARWCGCSATTASSAAVEAGGALRLLHHDVGGVELSEVHRFARPDEASAVLRLRVGDRAAVDFYADNDRLIGGVGPRSWTSCIGTGRPTSTPVAPRS